MATRTWLWMQDSVNFAVQNATIMRDQSNSMKKNYRIKETAELLDISRTTVDAWCQKGILTKIRVNKGARRVYISAESVENVANFK